MHFSGNKSEIDILIFYYLVEVFLSYSRLLL